MHQKNLIPLEPSTGGVLAPEQVIGREEYIRTYWDILSRQGIVLYAERRFGKSSILRKMNAENKVGFLTIYKGIEGVESLDGFVNGLFEHIKEKKLIEEGMIGKAEEIYNTFTDHVPDVGGIKFKRTNKKWENQLRYLLSLLMKQHQDKCIVIMLDEFTIMLSKLKDEDAVNILGYLRDLVQHEFKDRLRFVFCGSVGIDLVLDKIKANGHNIGDPINHMNKQRVRPFEDEEAIYFSECLSLGCRLDLSYEVKDSICKQADNIPYFIDSFFDKIRNQHQISLETVDQTLQAILEDPDNQNNLEHFYDRIRDYYPNKMLTNQILNYISYQNDFVTEAAIAGHLNITTENERLQLNEEMDRLRTDGYLVRKSVGGNRQFQFNYSIIKKWWSINKAY